jgi:hypothetical protein
MTCKTHPDAPHGFLRDASHLEDRYVCECEFWEPPEEEKQKPVADFEVVSYSTGYRNHNDPSAGHGFAVMKGLRYPKCKHEFTPASWYGPAECPECDHNTHPQPKREWVSLTDEEREELMDNYDVASPDYAKAIEAKLRERNT